MKLPDKALLPGAIALVVVIVFTVYSPSLACYYFSEDIIQNWIAYQALTAHPELLLQHLTMPWIQCSNMGLFCRPLVEYSFIADRLLFGWTAFAAAGTHMTNLICHMVSTVLCLLLGRRLIEKHLKWSDVQATICATTTALIFGLYPLQAETIYWLCCRCDCLATMLSLTTIYLALLAQGKDSSSRLRYIVFSAAAYFLAVLSKENAVMAPAVIALYALMYPSKTSADDLSSGKISPIALLKTLAPYLIVISICALIRFSVLGGIGGYHGTYGAVFDARHWQGLLDPMAWNKLFYPLDEQRFYNWPAFPFIFSIAYLIMAVGAVQGLKTGAFDRAATKLILFCIVAGILLMATALKVFLIMDSLVGGHFIYLSQAFWGLAMSIFFMSMKPQILKRLFIPAYIFLLIVTTTVNSSAWAVRGLHMRALQNAALDWASNPANAGRRFCLLNMPLDAREFSSVYDLEQLRCLLKPPLAKDDLSASVAEPSYIRMAADVGCKTRIASLVQSGDVDFVLSSVALGTAWQVLKPAAMAALLAPINETVGAHLLNIDGQNKNVSCYEIDLSTVQCPQRADLIEVHVRRNGASPGKMTRAYGQPLMFCPSGNTVTVTWHTDLSVIDPAINWSTAPFNGGGGAETVFLFPLADRISWKYSNTVHKLLLTNLPADFEVTQIRLLDESAFTPKLTADSNCEPVAAVNEEMDRDGYYPVNDRQSARCSFDAGAVSGAKSVILQISERDFVYSNYADGYRESYTITSGDSSGKHTFKTIARTELKGTIKFSRKDFPLPGKYQVRLAACDANGRTTGFCSDPIDLLVSDRPFKDAYEKAMFNLRALKQTGAAQ